MHHRTAAYQKLCVLLPERDDSRARSGGGGELSVVPAVLYGRLLSKFGVPSRVLGIKHDTMSQRFRKTVPPIPKQ